jgi:hypothetical protein
MISLWKRVYGESPLHLLGQLVAFVIAVYAFTQAVEVGSTDVKSLLIWFLAGALLHDLLFVPIYLGLDRVARRGVSDHAQRRVRLINHIRYPAAISGVMFLTLFPLIIGRAEPNYVRLTGEQVPDWLGRWLLVTAVAFGISALAYAVRLRRETRNPTPPSTLARPTA